MVDLRLTGRATMKTRATHLWLLLAVAGAGPAGASDPAWLPVATVGEVKVEAKPTASGFHATRGSITLCTGLQSLLNFLGNPSRFPEWIPYTEEARSLERSADAQIFYMRTATPGPARSRDMIYRAERQIDAGPGQVRLVLEGLPDHLPPQPNAVRMRAACGEWLLERHDGYIRASLQLEVNPGRVPRQLANRRQALIVGGALANLAERFPCPRP
ncbi:MAG: hypothetical protein ACNA7W_07860 [Pseudomonadales bacterium]